VPWQSPTGSAVAQRPVAGWDEGASSPPFGVQTGQVIRNVLVGRLRPGVPREAVEQALAAIVVLQPDGCLDMRVDAGLRPGNWNFAISADFVDEQAYRRRYDLEAEHNRVREELFVPICEDIACDLHG